MIILSGKPRMTPQRMPLQKGDEANRLKPLILFKNKQDSTRT